MALTASNDINNLGGSVIAQDSLNLNAGNNINIQSTTQDSAYSTSKTLAGDKAFSSTATGTNIDRIAGLYVTGGANSLLVAQADNDLNINAAEINNTSTDGFTLLKANHNINLGTVTENTHSYTTVKGKGNSGWTDRTSKTETGSRIDTTGDIALEAGNNVSAKAAQVTSDNGALNVVAGQDISIVNGTRTDTSQSYSKKSSRGSLSSKSKTRYDTSADTQIIASTFSGDSVNLSAGRPVNNEEATGAKGNITIRGSNVVGSNDVNLNASNNISIESAQATHDETHYSKTKKSGFTASSTSIGYGSSKLTNTNDTQTTTNIGSTVGSVEGNVNINAGKDYTQTASDILTPSGDINITAQEVTIKAATDTYANQQSMKYKQSGITVSVSSSALNLAKGVAATTEAAVTSDSNGNKVLNALQTYANGSTLYEQGKAAAGAVQAGNVQDAARAAGVKLSVSIGSTSAKSSSSTTIATQQDSLIKASGNVTIKAMQDDLTVKGSQIEADKNITLEAAKNINLVASADTESNQSKNKSSSTSIGVSVGVGAGGAGFSVDLAASRGKGNANSDSTSYNNTHVTAGETLTLNSGNDTNLIGANTEGKKVIANVGGNLNIQSLLDTVTSKAKQSNTGISISVPVASPTLGNTFGAVSQSKQKSNSNYASVYEQSGIKAGEEGFNINVNNNTDLKGAVIESIAVPDKNKLTAGTLTTSNIQNHMEAETSSSGIIISTNMLNSKYGAIKGIAGNLQNHGEERISDSSTASSAISPANISITDKANQQQLTGKTTEETVVALNRDASNTNRVLAKPDLQALQEETQQAQADRMLLHNTVVAFTDEAFRKIFVDQTNIYKKVVDADGKVLWLKLNNEEKQNLQPGVDGKVHIFNNGIFNPLENAKNLATQNNNADYLVYFPEANNFFSELLVAGYQKYLEGNTLGLANATRTNVEIMNNYGSTGLQVDGHSRGGLTTGNALEAVASQNNTENPLSNTNVSLFGSAYNAQQAADFLNILSGGNGTVESQVHINDFVGTLIGGNTPTGGTTPEGSNLLREWVKIFYGKETAHNCYGNASQGCGVYWNDNVSKPTVIAPNHPDLGGAK